MVRWAIVYQGKTIALLSSRVDAVRVWQDIKENYSSQVLLQRWKDGIPTQVWNLI